MVSLRMVLEMRRVEGVGKPWDGPREMCMVEVGGKPWDGPRDAQG